MQSFHRREDHALNLCVDFLKSFIFTGIQRVKTGLFCKSNSVSFTDRWFIYDVMDQCTDMERLHHKCTRLRLLVTRSITIKQNHSIIGYDCIESNHDYNRDYICLETSSKRKQTHSHSLMGYDMNACNKRNY